MTQNIYTHTHASHRKIQVNKCVTVFMSVLGRRFYHLLLLTHLLTFLSSLHIYAILCVYDFPQKKSKVNNWAYTAEGYSRCYFNSAILCRKRDRHKDSNSKKKFSHMLTQLCFICVFFTSLRVKTEKFFFSFLTVFS